MGQLHNWRPVAAPLDAAVGTAAAKVNSKTRAGAVAAVAAARSGHAAVAAVAMSGVDSGAAAPGCDGQNTASEGANQGSKPRTTISVTASLALQLLGTAAHATAQHLNTSRWL